MSYDDTEALKRAILANNLVGKFMETFKLLLKVYSKDELKQMLDDLARILEDEVEIRNIYYYNSHKPSKLELVTSWEYKKEDFE